MFATLLVYLALAVTPPASPATAPVEAPAPTESAVDTQAEASAKAVANSPWTPKDYGELVAQIAAGCVLVVTAWKVHSVQRQSDGNNTKLVEKTEKQQAEIDALHKSIADELLHKIEELSLQVKESGEHTSDANKRHEDEQEARIVKLTEAADKAAADQAAAVAAAAASVTLPQS